MVVRTCASQQGSSDATRDMSLALHRQAVLIVDDKVPVMNKLSWEDGSVLKERYYLQCRFWVRRLEQIRLSMPRDD